MKWPPKIERFRKYVLWECKDIPPDLILAIIQNESGGQPGIAGRRGTKCGPLPSVNGGTRDVCQAYGLMQIHPHTVASWNEKGDEVAFIEDMEGNDERAIRLQIRIGCWYLARCVAGLHRWDSSAFPSISSINATEDQVRLALIGYAVGLGAVLKKLKQLKAANRPLTYNEIVKTFPDWGKNKQGKWINRPLFYANKVFTKFRNHAGNAGGSSTQAPTLAQRAKKAMEGGGWLLLPVLGLAAWKAYEQRK